MNVKDLDIIFISFDEPNADENFLDLKRKFPHAKRVHGVVGFDKSHLQASEMAETESFFIVDGDNKVTNDFAGLTLDNYDPTYVYSWSSKNIINGLVYGNGGVKLWNKKHFENLNCHDQGLVDWCFQIPYFQMNDWYSYCMCNSSPFQAFRAGFREGVKFGLGPKGGRIDNLQTLVHALPESTQRRLFTWLTVGADVTNGLYAIYGARLGFLKVVCEKDFNIDLISNYAWFEEIWNKEFSFVRDGYFLEHYSRMASDIRQILDIPITDLDSVQSELMKKVMFNPKREGPMLKKGPEEQYSINLSHFKKEY